MGDLGSAINWSDDLLDTDTQSYSDALQIILDAFQTSLHTLASDSNLSVDDINIVFNDGTNRRRRVTPKSNVSVNVTFANWNDMHGFNSRVRRVVHAAAQQSSLVVQRIST